MAKVHDQEALDAYRRVLLDLGHVNGYVVLTRLSRDWIENNLKGILQNELKRMMIAHVKNGGTVDQIQEKRPDYVHWRFHYDIRLPTGDRRIYVETTFNHEPDVEDCRITVVNVHDA